MKLQAWSPLPRPNFQSTNPTPVVQTGGLHLDNHGMLLLRAIKNKIEIEIEMAE